jgi:hypothetical protein
VIPYALFCTNSVNVVLLFAWLIVQLWTAQYCNQQCFLSNYKLLCWDSCGSNNSRWCLYEYVYIGYWLKILSSYLCLKLQKYQNTSYRFKNSRILSDVSLTYHISKEDNAQRFVAYANREIDNPCNLKGLRVIKQSLQIRVSFT